MNGGHKITGGLAEEACPPVDSSTLQSYASHLQVTTDHYKKWTDKAPYLVVVKRFAEGKYNISKVVERYQEVCKGATDRTTSTSVVWVRELARESRQDPEGEDELERAFQVSPKAIIAAPCQVELAIACQQDHPDSRLNNVDDLAIKQRKPITLKQVEADQIDIYSQEVRSPRLPSVGSFPSLRLWQGGAWQRVEGASTSLRQDTSEPNPRLRYRPFDFHVTASLLG
ncbi:unnamed protein product [Symbiodinium sp. CCMP2592]|nr:unnamed protein product [Symbiodinium sp. CCMP2592]